ncbi:MAG: 5'/3'-nucleotidase SurE [Chloroflexi bacterium]|jgi:5'-nucleotidase|nr:5'/3'-nucleotidase SurE [Chloroflexota bacterium]BCY18097.1 5'-nucleotidase SurE [Leptolinea sp. HRD-7]
MHIVVTNDDGVFAPGLLALAAALKRLGKVSVVAPDHNWSASGHVKTLHRPLRVKEVELEDGTPALACDGAPSDCIALAALGLLPEPIDFVVSGINPNANLGHDLTYSGTVTAAMEGAIWGIPSVAVSVDAPEYHRGPLDYTVSAEMGCRVVEKLMHNPISPDVLLNVNVPYLPADQLKGFAITRQGLRIYRDELVKREDPRGRAYYWIGGEPPTGVKEDGTDIGEVSNGYVSVTPIQLDLTAHKMISDLKKWDLQLQ